MAVCHEDCAYAEHINIQDTTCGQSALILCAKDDETRMKGEFCPYRTVKPQDNISVRDIRPEAQSSPDMVNSPPHYRHGNIECIDALEAATNGLVGWESGLTWNVIKYMWRWKHKNGLEDLQKARWYLSRLIEKVEKSQKGSVQNG